MYSKLAPVHFFQIYATMRLAQLKRCADLVFQNYSQTKWLFANAVYQLHANSNIICELTPLNFENDQYLISLYSDTVESFITIMRIKEMITNLGIFDFYTNSLFQYQIKCIEKSIENMDTEHYVRVYRLIYSADHTVFLVVQLLLAVLFPNLTSLFTNLSQKLCSFL